MNKNLGGSLVYFTLPTIGFGYMYGLINLYLMIFATDFLAIAPATVGFIFGISRLWDAISDPLIGHLNVVTNIFIFGHGEYHIRAHILRI